MNINPKVRLVLRLGFMLAVAFFAVECVAALVVLTAGHEALSTSTWIAYALYFVTLTTTTVGCILVIVFGYKERLDRARMAARIAVIFLILNSLLEVTTAGIDWRAPIYLFQLAILICFQLYTDADLSRPKHFSNPFKGRAESLEARREEREAQQKEERAELEKDYREKTGKDLKGYIPLNYFNLFWIFIVCSILGLLIEVVFHAIVYGGYESRAGLLWGPFSPIYGFGAVLMTLALNRFWNRSTLVIFLVAGLIGAAFEFFVSFFLQYAFGIIAWDYSGTFLSIGGRTNFSFFCAWGFLGLVWIKLLLPDVLRVVNAIPLKWRSGITVVATVLMLFNGVCTLVALDCWYMREAGQPVQTAIERFAAVNFNDQFMAARFQTMSVHPDEAARID